MEEKKLDEEKKETERPFEPPFEKEETDSQIHQFETEPIKENSDINENNLPLRDSAKVTENSWWKKKFWFLLALVFFVSASLIAYQIIWVSLTPQKDYVTLGILQNSNSGYMGLSPPFKDFLFMFRDTNDIEPESFKNYIKGDRTQPFITPNYVTCEPNGGYLFEEEREIRCDLSGFKNLPDYVEVTLHNPNGDINSTFIAFPFVNISLCSIDDPYNCSRFNGGFSNSNYILLYTPNSGMYRLRLSVLWNEHSVSSEPAIEYFDATKIRIYSKMEALDIYQKEKERGYQLIIAIFALVGIFPAVYNLKKLWENK